MFWSATLILFLFRMSVELAKSGLVLPLEEVAKLSKNNQMHNGALVTNVPGWGPIRLHIVRDMKRVPIEQSIGTEEPWITRIPQKTPYAAYSLKESRMFFQMPQIFHGNVRTIGLSPLRPAEDGMEVTPDFLRFAALAKHDQSAAMGNFMTPEEERSRLSLALVEMEEPVDGLFGDEVAAQLGLTRNRLALPKIQSVPTRTLKNILGIFDIGIEAPISVPA